MARKKKTRKKVRKRSVTQTSSFRRRMRRGRDKAGRMRWLRKKGYKPRKPQRRSSSRASMKFIRSQGFKSRKAYNAALHNIARVNETFMRTPIEPQWFFEWFGADGRSHQGYNSVHASNHAEAAKKAMAMGRRTGLRPDLNSLTTKDISRRWSSMFD